jgi:alpha/beta superfamily hydrolase
MPSRKQHDPIGVVVMILQAGEVQLEAVLWEPRNLSPKGAALVCHPHPLYGGTMNNRVTFRAARGAVDAGLAVLRFNFRGVGRSTGAYAKGIGELKDAAFLMDWLQARYPALPLAVIGFSFGAWIGLQAGCHNPRVRTLVGLGLPVDGHDFEFLIDNDKPSRYIIGTRDKFCARDPMKELELRLPATSTVVWVDGADHFFTHHIELIRDLVGEFLKPQF